MPFYVNGLPIDGDGSSTSYTSASSTGWTISNGNGLAEIDGGFEVSYDAGTAANLYPGSSHARIYRDVSQVLPASGDWTITARVVSASLHSESRLGIGLGDSSDASGVIIFLGPDNSLGLGQWDNSGDAGTVGSACPFDGTGWVRLISRGGLIAAGCGTGTTTTQPSLWYTIQPGRARGSAPFQRLTIYIAKWGGAATSGSFDNITITAGT